MIEKNYTCNKTNNYESFSIGDTNVLKGIAILLMLIHHLFYEQTGRYSDIHIFGNHYFINELGRVAKLCVSLFVFLSGYGLMAQTEHKGCIKNIKNFYIHRFKKLYLNYWFIWLIFVPISYVCYGMTFENAYHNNLGWHLLADIWGLHSLFFNDTYCYNPTWWFYSCIILLYLFFPFMYKLIKRNPLLLILTTLGFSFLPMNFISIIKFHIVAFALGMWSVNYRITISKYSFIAVITLLSCYIICSIFNGYSTMIDCIIVLLLYISYRTINLHRYIKSVLTFLGNHSMNIFLFHTFIQHFWFQDFIYESRNPLIILLTLLSVCVLISMLLEKIKKYTIYQL